MKAFKTRKASVQPQYDSAMKDIRHAMGWGWKSTHVGYGTLYPEVAEMIAKDGFDIKIVKRADDSMSYNKVSWENAEEGKEGTITYVDETQPQPDFTDILVGKKMKLLRQKKTNRQPMKKMKLILKLKNKANTMRNS